MSFLDAPRKMWNDLAKRPGVLLVLGVVFCAIVIGVSIATSSWFYVGGFFGGLLLILSPVPTALGGYATIIPFDNVLALGQQSRGRTLTWVVGLVAGIVLLAVGLLTKRLERPSRAATCWVLLLMWSIASVLWCADQQVTVHQIPTFVGLVMFYAVATSFRLRPDELRSIVWLTILGAVTASLFTIHSYYQGQFFVTMRGSLIFGDRETNPNAFAVTLLLPYSLAMSSAFSAARWPRRVLFLGIAAVLGYAILITMSRGGVLAFFVLLGVHFWRLPRQRRLLAFLAVFLLLATSLLPNLFFTRIEEATATGGAGRVEIWKAGWAMFKHDPIIGVGLYNFASVYPQFAGYESRFVGFHRDAHNLYLAVATELGSVGLMVLLAAIVSELRQVTKVYRALMEPDPILVGCEAACFAVLVAGCFVNAWWYKAFWLPWILLAHAIRAERERAAELEFASSCPPTMFSYEAVVAH